MSDEWIIYSSRDVEGELAAHVPDFHMKDAETQLSYRVEPEQS
jgi:hypothetical protein